MTARSTYIGMGELGVAKASEVLEIRGLGSCIALALHDPLQRLAGLSHIVLPRPLAQPPTPTWVATEAVPALLDAMEAEGARTTRLVARIAGGSSMFPGLKKGYEVGQENADVVEQLLRSYRIPVLSRQIGGHASRNVRLRGEDGRFEVTTTQLQPKAVRAAAADPAESAYVLIQTAAAPLADILKRPVTVEHAGRYDLTRTEAVGFLGPQTRMRWSELTYTREGHEERLHLVVPETHARRIDEELRPRLDEPSEEDSAADEVLNIMLSHTLTAVAKLQRTTLRPQSVAFHRGATPEFLGSVMDGDAATITVAHAHLTIEAAFHGADIALLGEALP